MTAFSPADLPLDTAAMMATLKRWVQCESPSYDGAAVNRMAALAADEIRMMGGEAELVPGSQGFGDCVRARFAEPGAPEGGVLLMGHLDTVHPMGMLNEMPWREEAGRCHGPGILDMKSGLVLALAAIGALRQAGLAPPLPITALLDRKSVV